MDTGVEEESIYQIGRIMDVKLTGGSDRQMMINVNLHKFLGIDELCVSGQEPAGRRAAAAAARAAARPAAAASGTAARAAGASASPRGRRRHGRLRRGHPRPHPRRSGARRRRPRRRPRPRRHLPGARRARARAEPEPVEVDTRFLQKVIDNWEKSWQTLRNGVWPTWTPRWKLQRLAPADAFVSKKNIDYVGPKRDAGRKFCKPRRRTPRRSQGGRGPNALTTRLMKEVQALETELSANWKPKRGATKNER